METNSIQDLKDTYQKLAFIHNKMLGLQFYPEEFQVCDAAMKMLTKMCNDLAADIDARETPANPEGAE